MYIRLRMSYSHTHKATQEHSFVFGAFQGLDEFFQELGLPYLMSETVLDAQVEGLCCFWWGCSSHKNLQILPPMRKAWSVASDSRTLEIMSGAGVSRCDRT